MSISNYLIQFDTINGEKLSIIDKKSRKALYNLSYILEDENMINDIDLKNNIEGVLAGIPLAIKYQVQNDYDVDISDDITQIINGNMEGHENSIDTLLTRDLLEIVKEVIKMKEARKI